MNMSTEQIIGIALAIAAAIGRAILWLLRNREARAVAAVVVEAGAIAAHYALGAARAGIKRAQEADSPGGVAVTPEELQRIVRASVLVGLDHVDARGAFEEVVAALGGQQVLEQRIIDATETMLRDRGYPVGGKKTDTNSSR